MHEEADGQGDIEATLWLDFCGLHAGGGKTGGPAVGCPQKEKECGGIPASRSPTKHNITHKRTQSVCSQPADDINVGSSCIKLL